MAKLSYISSAFLLLFVMALVVEVSHGGGEGSLKPEQCAPECDRRCSATAHKHECVFFCNYCCKKCLCVPSGTYGHKEECPCYNNWKTKEGNPKCP